MRLAKALFEKEEAILPGDEAWDDPSVSQSYYMKCAIAVVVELAAMSAELADVTINRDDSS
jgi:hypothetical protein